jgi:hypothetical protein
MAGVLREIPGLSGAWVVLTVMRGEESRVARALPSACRRRGFGAEAWLPTLETRTPKGLSSQLLLPGFVLAGLSEPRRVAPRLKGWVDDVTGFLAAVGADRPGLISPTVMAVFREAVEQRNLGQRPVEWRAGDRVTVLGGVCAEVLRAERPGKSVVALTMFGRMVEASVQDLRSLQNNVS